MTRYLKKSLLEKLTKKQLHLWVCDYSKNSGEGKLARLFIKNLKDKEKVIVKINKRNNLLRYKYFSPLLGIIYCWKHYLLGKKIGYINYLPLWNFVLFILLPPKTILGPITGGAKFSKYNIFNYYFRRILFPIFYKISQLFLIFRSNKIIFSTDLLKKYLFNRISEKSKFNFAITQINIKKNFNLKKNIDFLLYYREHKNKKTFFPYNFIKKISLANYNICVVGDKLHIKNIKNLGFLKNKSIEKLQSRSKFTIASGENIYSLFTIECLANGIKILIDKEYKNQIKFYKSRFLVINFNKINQLSKFY